MNEKIIEKLSELINLMRIELSLIHNNDIKTTNIYRITALEKNRDIIKKLGKEIVTVDDVANIKGFGKGTIGRIEEILYTGNLQEVIYLKRKIKKLYKLHILVEEISKVIGIGSITALRLVEEHKLKSLQELKEKVKNGTIEVNDKIKLGLKYEGKYSTDIKRKNVTKIFEKIKDIINMNCMICGSYRRGLPTSHDIDLLIWDKKYPTDEDIKKSDKLHRVVEKLTKNGYITDDITNLNYKNKYMGFIKYHKKIYRIDIRFISMESLYTAIVYFTGSYEFNIKMRNRAKKLAYKLNEYGLYNVMGKRVPIESEEQLFEKLRMTYVEPWER